MKQNTGVGKSYIDTTQMGIKKQNGKIYVGLNKEVFIKKLSDDKGIEAYYIFTDGINNSNKKYELTPGLISMYLLLSSWI